MQSLIFPPSTFFVDIVLALLACVAFVSHAIGMYQDRQKPVQVALGLFSVVITLAAVITVDQMKNSTTDFMKCWFLVKQFSVLLAGTAVLLAIRLHLALPWIYAVVAWLMAINSIVLGTAIIIWIDEHFDILFPGQRRLSLA
jgi:hypothetical protein